MISFKPLHEDNVEKTVAELTNDEGALSELLELVYGLDTDIPDVEFALSYSSGCALVRVFDMGRYIFLYPFAVTDYADTSAALFDIAEYAMREEIRLVVDDVPKDCVSDFLSFRHIDIDASDPYGESFRITVKTECELMDDVPSAEVGRVKLNALCEEDIPDYARLCKDKNINKYWGYDYSEDVDDPDDEYFYESAIREINLGISVTMAVRLDGRFIGEAVLYAFDGRGSAEFGVRLLPQWHGKGLGTESVRAISLAARDLGLVRLSAIIMKQNRPSVRMLEKVADSCEYGDSEAHFSIDLLKL